MIRQGWFVSLLILACAGSTGCQHVGPPSANIWNRKVATFESTDDTTSDVADDAVLPTRQVHSGAVSPLRRLAPVDESTTVALMSFQRPVPDPSRHMPDRMVTTEVASEPLLSVPEALPAPSRPSPPVPDFDDRPSAPTPPLEMLEQIPTELLGEPLTGTLTLNQVIDSVYAAYPLLEVAVREREIAAGKVVSAEGEFDLSIKGFSIAAPMGYYKNYRSALALTQPTYRGGYLYGGYKIGDDDIQPWFKERLTNEGGEFAMGVGHPLLKNRSIDKRRAALARANLARQAVEPAVSAQLLDFVRAATQAYWSWVAAGQSLEAQRQILQLAKDRVEQIELRVRSGDLQRIVRINNDQLIASRETKMIEAERKLQAAAIKLSLFLRNPAGQPVIPSREQAPREFPTHFAPDASQTAQDIATALSTRPELVELELLCRQVQVELQQAAQHAAAQAGRHRSGLEGHGGSHR